jgi:hypothetical protein
MSSVAAHLRDDWRQLRRAPPGRRFQTRYDQARRERGSHAWLTRALKIVGGILAILIALAEIVFPGPAILFFLLGGSLLATESRTVARFMDWSELKIRAAIRWARGVWHAASMTVRAVIVCVIVLFAGAGLYGMYRLWQG